MSRTLIRGSSVAAWAIGFQTNSDTTAVQGVAFHGLWAVVAVMMMTMMMMMMLHLNGLKSVVLNIKNNEAVT